MQIVLQSASISYSLIPPYPLIAAPMAPLLLPAPRIGGLICAPKPIIVVEQYTALDQALEAIRSKEEMDAEIETLWAEGRERQHQLREALEARLIEKRRLRQKARMERYQS